MADISLPDGFDTKWKTDSEKLNQHVDKLEEFEKRISALEERVFAMAKAEEPAAATTPPQVA